ncbi:protein FAM163A-like [Heterodontus francisci]|uniref:protein FAM163A-like n=1 Tax=Heterodontus francisci TaxID=7792 RepID=UPI00355BE27C
MTAGTVVITGGILATVILLCIIGVLCYCRLQYYCCKKDESDDEEEGSDSPLHPPFACNSCSAHVVDGLVTQLATPVEASHTASRSSCPNCSPHRSPFYIQTTDEMRNGGGCITYTPAHYKEPGPVIKMPSLQGFPVSRQNTMWETLASVRAISTEV